MEYPGTKFTSPLRLVFLYSLIALFFIISPVIILYTAGYRYDFKNGFLKQTGAISVDVEPKNAVVYLNGLRIKDKIPVRLNNIAPAKYNLRVTAAGYYEWNKEIEVKNKQTVYIKEISLVKKAEPTLLATRPITALDVSDKGRYILYATRDKNAAGVELLDTKDEMSRKIISLPDASFDPRVAWAAKNECALITDPEPPYDFASTFCADNPGKIQDIAKTAAAPMEKIQWGDESNPTLYFQTKKGIFSYAVWSGRLNTITTDDYADWFMENGELWTLQTNTSSRGYTLVKNTLGFSSVFAMLDFSQTEETPELKILLAEKSRALLKKSGVAEMIILDKDKKFTVSGEDFYLSPYNDWLLVWTPWELWTHSAGEDPYLLNRSGEHLNKVFPMDKYNTLALSWKDKITALFPYYYVSNKLLDEPAVAAAADTERKILYFVRGGGLWKLGY